MTIPGQYRESVSTLETARTRTESLHGKPQTHPDSPVAASLHARAVSRFTPVAVMGYAVRYCRGTWWPDFIQT